MAESVNKWLDEAKEDLIENYNALGLRASGNWANTLTTFFEESETNFKLGFIGEDYTYYLENGRGKTSATGPYQKSAGLKVIIRKWIDDKGIQPDGNISKDSLAFLITRKIHRDGIKVGAGQWNEGGIISDILTKQRIEELLKEIAAVKLNEIRTDILKSIKLND